MVAACLLHKTSIFFSISAEANISANVTSQDVAVTLYNKLYKNVTEKKVKN